MSVPNPHVIVLCDFARPNGGSEKVALQSARALAEAGVRVTFLHAVAGRDDSLDHQNITVLDLGLADIWDRPVIAGAVDGIWNARVRASVRAHLQRFGDRNTVVHLHQWTRAFSPSVFAAVSDTGLPLFVTAHDYFLACPNGLYFLFKSGTPCHLQPLGLPCIVTNCDPKSPAHKAVRVARTIATRRALARQPVDVIHVSDRGRAVLTPFLPDGVRHHRLDNPIDVPWAEPATIGAEAPFAFIGRLTREKGAVLAAAAAAAAGVDIIFLGEGPARDEIRQVNPQAQLLGWQTPDAVRRRLAGGIRAVVAPSLWDETGPLTIAEAAAAGVAGIASRRCGAAERIDAGVTGFVVESDVAALAGAMTKLNGAGVAERMGQAAHARFWADPPTPGWHAARLQTLYAGAIA